MFYVFAILQKQSQLARKEVRQDGVLRRPGGAEYLAGFRDVHVLGRTAGKLLGNALEPGIVGTWRAGMGLDHTLDSETVLLSGNHHQAMKAPV